MKLLTSLFALLLFCLPATATETLTYKTPPETLEYFRLCDQFANECDNYQFWARNCFDVMDEKQQREAVDWQNSLQRKYVMLRHHPGNLFAAFEKD